MQGKELQNHSRHSLTLLVFGAGAIGTYVGGSIAIAGHSVVFIERPALIPVLRQQGLHLDLVEHQEHIASPMLAGSIEEALSFGPYGAAIFALKSYDTHSVLDELRRHADSLPPFLCLQNGVENELALESALGSGKVIAGSLTSAIGRHDIGDIVLDRMRGVGIASGHPISMTLVQVMNEAGLNARLYPNAADMKWSKLVTNLMGNATSAILGMPPEGIYAHPALYRLELTQLREALAVMHAQGIHPVNLPATPVILLAFIVRRLPARFSHLILKRVVGRGRGSKMPSFYIDLYAGIGKSEVDYLNGAVSRNGARLGVPTPVNSFLTQTLLAITQGDLDKEVFARQPDKLVAAYCDFTTP